MASVLDTHRIVKRLRDAGVPDELAETWTDILRETRELDLSQLATKGDLELVRADLRREIGDTRTELIKWTVGVGFAQVVTLIGALFAFLKLFPGGTP